MQRVRSARLGERAGSDVGGRGMMGLLRRALASQVPASRASVSCHMGGMLVTGTSRIPLEFWLPLENVRGLWYSYRCPASLPPTLPTFTASQRSWDAGSVARRVVRCGLGCMRVHEADQAAGGSD